MGRLDDTSMLVTGGGSGLGRAIVSRCVEEGARVVVFDRSKEKLEEVAGAFGDAVRTVAGDVTSVEDNEAAVAAAVGDFGGLDVLVGNAGIWDFNASLESTDAEQLASGFDELFGVNVKGYLLGAKAALPALRASRGSMVFTLSNAAFFPGGGGPLYTAAKHAGVGLIRQLAYELAPEVRVNGVAPGGMATDLRGPGSLGLAGQSITEAFPIQDIMREHGPLKIDITPEDYVGTYLLLASRRESATVTGSVVDISGIGTPPRRGMAAGAE